MKSMKTKILSHNFVRFSFYHFLLCVFDYNEIDIHTRAHTHIPIGFFFHLKLCSLKHQFN